MDIKHALAGPGETANKAIELMAQPRIMNVRLKSASSTGHFSDSDRSDPICCSIQVLNATELIWPPLERYAYRQIIVVSEVF
jgi:hypothetical protein